jgi:sec-independent protein translocase protein TatC
MFIKKLKPGEEPVKEEIREMSFFDHLEELRGHLFRAVLAIVAGAIVMFVSKEFVFNTVIFGPKNPDFISYRLWCKLSHAIGMGDSICFTPAEFKFITPNMGELFLTHIKVSLFLGFVIAFPYVFWEFWRFIKPGLYEKEKAVTRYAVAVCSSLFLLGVLFGYFIVSPFAVTFLIGYNLPGVEAQPALSSYLSYLMTLTLPVGIVFELPVLAYVLAKIGVISSGFLKQYRKHAIVVIVIVAAVITPPDVFSQALVCLPLLGLYELSIWVCKRVERENAKEELQPI